MRKLLVSFFISCTSIGLLAQVPKTLSFQGYLTNTASGDALDGNLDMRFSLHDASTGGAELWFDDYSAIAVSKGLYNVILGDKKPIDLLFDKVYYLQVKVGLEILTPRITVTSSAYSLSSINASNITSGILNGALVGAGVNATNITTGIMDGALVGSGVSASNITTGTLPDARLSTHLLDLADGTLSGQKVGLVAGDNIIIESAPGNNVKISTGGSALSGLGANGQVAFWSGPGSFSSDANMVWDNSNKRLGLGVTPTQKLDVNGTVNATAFTGSGSGVTSLSATNVSSGTLADARLENTVDINALNVGASGQLAISSTGDLSKINNVAYSFPLTQGASSSFLSNNGAGSLSWTATIPGTQIGTGINASNITTGSLNASLIGSGAVTSSMLQSDASNDANRAVTTLHIRDNAVATGKIPNGAVTSDKLQGDASIDGNRAVSNIHVKDGAINNAKLGSDLDAAKLTTGTLPIARIGDGAVTSAKITDGTIAVGDIADGAINSAKLNDGTIATIDVADDAITFDKLRDDASTDGNRAVTTNHVRDAAITNSKLASGIDAAKVTTGTLPIARIADGDVSNAKLASGIDASKLTTGTLPIARIADGDVTSAKITDGGVATIDIGDDAITASKLRDDASTDGNRAVTTDHIRDGAVTNAKIASGVDAAKITSGLLATANGGTGANVTPVSGGVSYGASSQYAFTAAGSTGQLLQSNGSSAPGFVSNISLGGYAAITGGLHVGGSAAPTNNLEVDGFSKLGSTAPAFKMVKVTGNTSSSAAGGSVGAAHSIADYTKIISVSVHVRNNSGVWIPANVVPSVRNVDNSNITGVLSGNFFFYYVSGTEVRVVTIANHSTELTNKPFVATILYTDL